MFGLHYPGRFWNNARMPTVRFVYAYCNDLEAMRRFYADLLGLPQTSVENGRNGGFIELDCGGFRLAFLQAAAPRPVATELSKLPGCTGGEIEQALCSIEYSAEDYAAVIARLAAAGHHSPQPDGEWSYPVLDPMGNTVEVYRAFGDEVPAGAENCAVSK
jgi:catechol 2,3-dioxygenase-like lactoylglutathione lyase family enzyme